MNKRLNFTIPCLLYYSNYYVYFRWGYYNANISSESIEELCLAISQLSPHLISLKLDFGRWGCEQYGNLKIYSDRTITSIC